MKKLVVYNHGQDSHPQGEKALAFATVAERHGFFFLSPDYRSEPDPDKRVRQLLAVDLSDYGQVILVGSSMGGYVATIASETIRPDGLFLLAPAFYLSGYGHTEFNPVSGHIRVFHGWQDDIVPPENSWEFCKRHRLHLVMVDDGHRLINTLPELLESFDRFLASLS